MLYRMLSTGPWQRAYHELLEACGVEGGPMDGDGVAVGEHALEGVLKLLGDPKGLQDVNDTCHKGQPIQNIPRREFPINLDNFKFNNIRRCGFFRKCKRVQKIATYLDGCGRG